MRLLELHLKAFGPFTDQVLRMGGANQRLVLVHGPNESGKSSTRRAITALRFAIPLRSPDDFRHPYAQMRVGGVFEDAEGRRHALMRRKGKGNTLSFADFERGGVELPEPVPPSIAARLTAGLAEADYDTLFSLDHACLREGGNALARGEGEIGAALFQASTGVVDLSKILQHLDDTAKTYFMRAPQARNARINVALSEHRAQSARHRDALVRPARWEAVASARAQAREALDAAQAEHDRLNGERLLIKELIAVAPIVGALAHATTVAESLADAPLLAENASADRAVAQAELTGAEADAAVYAATEAEQRRVIDALVLDDAVLAVAESITRLHVAAGEIGPLRLKIAAQHAEVERCAQALTARAAAIDPRAGADELLRRAPSAPTRVQLEQRMSAVETAERDLAQHQRHRPAEAPPSGTARPIPDDARIAAVRVALNEVERHREALARLARLPGELVAIRRAADAALAAAEIPDEAAARRARPLLDATIDEAIERGTDLAARRNGLVQRIADMATALAAQRDEIAGLLAHGRIPTHDDVQQARAHRQAGWALVRAEYIERSAPDSAAFAGGLPLAEAYERAVDEADATIDELARDTDRAARLEQARRQLAGLERDIALRSAELAGVDQALQADDDAWRQQLSARAIPAMSAGQLRDWQARLADVIAQHDALQARRDERAQLEAQARDLADRLRGAVAQLGVTRVGDEPLDTLAAIAQDDLAQVGALVEARARTAGQVEEIRRQAGEHAARAVDLAREAQAAVHALAAQMPALMLATDATVAQARARLAEFDALAAAAAALGEARSRVDADVAALRAWRLNADSIASALGETTSEDLTTSADRWAARLAAAQRQQETWRRADQAGEAARAALAAAREKAARHRATLERLCLAAGVASAAELPDAEERSSRKRQAQRDADRFAAQLAQASRRDIDALRTLLGGRSHEDMSTEESRIERALGEAAERLERARAAEDAARRELEAIDASDEAAAAADAMARAAATVRNALPLHLRSRLAHALLKEAVRRFKERSQAPMLKSASRFFATITGDEYERLVHDDTHGTPVIAAKRRSGALVGIEAMSEGTRDQLYLALRLAALTLQRERGVELPVILDDVMMASDDARAGCIFRALDQLAATGQVIVFTHHGHLCDVARASVGDDRIAIVELARDR